MEGFCDVTLPPINNERGFHFMSQIEEDTELTDINDPEYNRLVDRIVRSLRSTRDDIIEAGKRLEGL